MIFEEVAREIVVYDVIFSKQKCSLRAWKISWTAEAILYQMARLMRVPSWKTIWRKVNFLKRMPATLKKILCQLLSYKRRDWWSRDELKKIQDFLFEKMLKDTT